MCRMYLLLFFFCLEVILLAYVGWPMAKKKDEWQELKKNFEAKQDKTFSFQTGYTDIFLYKKQASHTKKKEHHTHIHFKVNSFVVVCLLRRKQKQQLSGIQEKRNENGKKKS